jgi:hypothetical protein
MLRTALKKIDREAPEGAKKLEKHGNQDFRRKLGARFVEE